jgi:hypothetical protein
VHIAAAHCCCSAAAAAAAGIMFAATNIICVFAPMHLYPVPAPTVMCMQHQFFHRSIIHCLHPFHIRSNSASNITSTHTNTS